MGDFVVWLGGLPKQTEEEEILRFLKGFGDIPKVSIRSSPKDVFAFVTFATEKDGADAIAQLDGREFLRSGVEVQVSKASKQPQGSRQVPQRQARSRSRGRGGGGGNGRGDSRGSQYNDRDKGAIVWMGGLPRGVQEDEIREYLRGHGKIESVRIRSSEKDVFGFATFESREDALNAVEALDQQKFLNSTSIIQLRESNTARPLRDRKHDRDDYPNPRNRRSSSPRYAVRLENLPPDMDWQELKDVARNFGESIVLANIFNKSGVRLGSVHYREEEDALGALKGFHRRRMSGQDERLIASKEETWG